MTERLSIDPETAKRAEWALVSAIADLTEAALDHCSAADALNRLPDIILIAEETAVLGRALAAIARHAGR